MSLNEFFGRPVVLAFYPADWSPPCGDQMALYNEMLDAARYDGEFSLKHLLKVLTPPNT